MRNAIGFIPRHHECESDSLAGELQALTDAWHARQLHDALEADQRRREAYDKLFEVLRSHAAQLEELDQDGHSAALVVGNLLVELGHTESAHERLEALAIEVQRLRSAITEMKQRRAREASSAAKVQNLARYAQGVLAALVCGLVAFLVVVATQGAL